MSQVNPPLIPRLPRAFLNDPETRIYVEQIQTIIFQLYNRTGGESDSVQEVIFDRPSTFNALLQQSLRVIPDFTIDTTGFTVDTQKLTTDKVKA